MDGSNAKVSIMTRLLRRQKKSFVLSVSFCLLVPLWTGQNSPFWSNHPATPKGVYSSSKVASIPLETAQILKDDPSQFWDCDLAAVPCRFFSPHNFFQAQAQGFDYQRLGGNNNNLPAMTALSWSSSSNLLVDLPHNISFIHIHKCVGTTVKALFAQAKQRVSELENINTVTTAQLNHYKYSFGGGSSAKKELNQQRRQDHIEGMVQLQQQHQEGVVFTIVRDPLERFVSAVQQVMHYNDDFRQKCLRWTSRSTLRCAIAHARETNFLGDVHLIPMATHFRLWDRYETARIAVLHLQDVHVLATYLGLATHQNDTTTTTTMPHARDRSKVQYATSRVLANMSVQRDCTPAMIEQLCDLYAIDVLLLKSLGYESKYCS